MMGECEAVGGVRSDSRVPRAAVVEGSQERRTGPLGEQEVDIGVGGGALLRLTTSATREGRGDMR